MLRRILLSMIVVCFVMALSQPNARALTCVDGSWAAQISEADVVFRGRPISSQFLTEAAPPSPRPPSSYNEWDGDFIVHTFEVFDVLKGELGCSRKFMSEFHA